MVAADGSQALFQVAILDQHPAPHPPRLHFTGLAPDQDYALDCIWPQALAKPLGTFSAAALMGHGLQLPQTYPDTCLIYHLKACG